MANPEGTWTAFVPGTPRAWARHGAGVGTRPADQRWRNAVRAAWVEQVGCLNLTPPVTVALTLRFCGADPRCDASNLTKAVEDALGWLRADRVTPVYRDDNQVKRLDVLVFPPHYLPRGPGVFIRITTLPDWPSWPAAAASRSRSSSSGRSVTDSILGGKP